MVPITYRSKLESKIASADLAIAIANRDKDDVTATRQRVILDEAAVALGQLKHEQGYFEIAMAGSMNAVLTWWSVSLALLSSSTLGNEILARGTLLKAVPVFVALLVWLMRVLIIGTFTLNKQPEPRPARMRNEQQQKPAPKGAKPVQKRSLTPRRPVSRPVPTLSRQPSPAHTEGAVMSGQRDYR